VASFGSGYFVFVDDNFTQDRQYALDLLAALRAARKTLDDAGVDRNGGRRGNAVRASPRGVRGVFVGLETFNSRSLCAQNKGFNSPLPTPKRCAEFIRMALL
jgi:hypothetical protein